MKLARYRSAAHDNRLGLVETRNGTDWLVDVTPALEVIPPARYPFPPADQLIAHLPQVLARARQLATEQNRQSPQNAHGMAVSDACLLAPVANPGKIINAPINYNDHIAEAKADPNIKHGKDIKTIKDWGLFLKATSSLVGFGEGVQLRAPIDRPEGVVTRNDHECELAVIIGKTANQVTRAQALDYVAGYAIGLDMTVRGPEFPSFRKSVDSYALLGPWLTTADEIADPNQLDLFLAVNGQARQQASTGQMVFDVPTLIEYASRWYTLHPGDIILTGTPAGVGPVAAGDVMTVRIAALGHADIVVR
jgi:2-keto-4-pentenoate hydratase/2-oxohepta-3-ene-1,7-dioic acid hydratase in catechol pathway